MKKSLKKYTITEVISYDWIAKSKAQAEKMHLNASPAERDAHCAGVSEREIYEWTT